MALPKSALRGSFRRHFEDYLDTLFDALLPIAPWFSKKWMYISPIESLPFNHSHFPLNHDCWRKGYTLSFHFWPAFLIHVPLNSSLAKAHVVHHKSWNLIAFQHCCHQKNTQKTGASATTKNYGAKSFTMLKLKKTCYICSFWTKRLHVVRALQVLYHVSFASHIDKCQVPCHISGVSSHRNSNARACLLGSQPSIHQNHMSRFDNVANIYQGIIPYIQVHFQTIQISILQDEV